MNQGSPKAISVEIKLMSEVALGTALFLRMIAQVLHMPRGCHPILSTSNRPPSRSYQPSTTLLVPADLEIMKYMHNEYFLLRYRALIFRFHTTSTKSLQGYTLSSPTNRLLTVPNKVVSAVQGNPPPPQKRNRKTKKKWRVSTKRPTSNILIQSERRTAHHP